MSRFEIQTKSKLTEEETETLFGWGDDLWNNDRYGLTWAGSDVQFVGLENGKPVTHAGMFYHTVEIAGRDIELGGLNGVITLPQARGKGYGSQIVGAAEDHARDQSTAEFGMLFCHPELVEFYGPRGWHPIDGPVTIDQPDGPRLTPHTVMVYPFRDTMWPDGPFNLNSYPW